MVHDNSVVFSLHHTFLFFGDVLFLRGVGEPLGDGFFHRWLAELTVHQVEDFDLAVPAVGVGDIEADQVDENCN